MDDSVIAFADFLARRFGASYLLDISAKPDGGPHGPAVSRVRSQPEWGWSPFKPGALPHPDQMADYVLLAHGEQHTQLDSLAARLRGWLDHAPCALVVVPPGIAGDAPDDLAAWLGDHGLRVEFTGYTPDHANRLAVLANNAVPPRDPAPDSFRVVAIMTTYNANDVIDAVLDTLAAQGVQVVVIDNWSTDGTYERVQDRVGRGVVGVERFPPGGDAAEHRYNWGEMLARVEAVSRTLDADWFIHHDSDEFREAPWPDVSLRDAFYYVDRCGFNAVDFTVVNFGLVDDAFTSEHDPRAHFQYFLFGQRPGHFIQIKAWKNTGVPVDLASTGGHRAQFAGHRVYPYKFLLRHYPLRTRAQALAKIHARQQQTNRFERLIRGWHKIYEHLGGDDEAIFAQLCADTRATHTRFDPATFYADHLVARLSGVGLPRVALDGWQGKIPRWWVPYLRIIKQRLKR